jgi:hypothetical protein
MYTNIKNESVKLPKIQWVWQIAMAATELAARYQNIA